MNTQIEIKFFPQFSLIDVTLVPELIPANPNAASSQDYGFDFDDEQLARELSAPLALNVAPETMPLIAAEEFDSLYKWFIS